MTFNYLAWMYVCGGVGLLLLGEGRRFRLRSPEALTGGFMGLGGILAIWGFLKALEQLSGIVFFPMKAVFGVILTAVLAVLFFGERLTRRQILGILVGAAAAALVNLKNGGS